VGQINNLKDNEMKDDNRRIARRYNIDLFIQISIGSQLSIKGRIKNISLKSALIFSKDRIFLDQNDDLKFKLLLPKNDQELGIEGSARVSRIDPSGGLAIYFTEMDTQSTKKLEELLSNNSKEI